MKNLFFSFLLVSTFFACHKDGQKPGDEIPSCIKAKMDSKLQAIKTVNVNGEIHYWLNTGDLAFDGPEYIVNANCETVCTFSFSPPKPCHAAYEGKEWKVIWEK